MFAFFQKKKCSFHLAASSALSAGVSWQPLGYDSCLAFTPSFRQSHRFSAPVATATAAASSFPHWQIFFFMGEDLENELSADFLLGLYVSSNRKERKKKKRPMESWKPAAHAVGLEAEALQKRSAFHYCYIVSFLMLTQGVKCKRGQRGKPNCVHCTGCYWASGLAVTCGFILFSSLCHFSGVTWGGVRN